MLIYIIVVNVFSDEKEKLRQKDKLIWALVILSFWVSLIAIFQRFGFLPSPENFWPRVTGPFIYPNALGLLLSPLVLIMTTWFLSIKNEELRIKNYKNISKGMKEKIGLDVNKKKFLIFNSSFLIITILMSVSAISLAHSEGAAVGVIIAMVIVGFIMRAKKTPKLMLLPKLMIIFVVVGVMLSSVFFLRVVPEYKYFNFDKEIFNYISDKAMLKDISGEIRKQQWRETWQVLTASPKNFILALALSGYQEAIKPIHQEGIFFNFERDEEFRTKIVWFDEEYKAKHWQPVEVYMYPHNFFLNFWVELGLLGAVLFVWLFIKIIILCFKLLVNNDKDRYIILGILGAIIVIIVHGIVDVPYFKNDIAVMFWVILGLLGL
jgi:O-antigen ligase